MSQPNISPTRPLEPEPKAIVVGASSGVGAALLKQLATDGYQVAALARREQELEATCAEANRLAGAAHVSAYVHDVTNFDDVPPLFQQIVRDLGGLDLIVYAAGIQPPVEANEYNFEKDATMVAINLIGAMAWLNEAAQRFQQVGAGHIVGISSISGDRGRSAFPAYHASKGGLSIYLESLRNRLSRRGVAVTTIKPGFVDTRLLANASKTFWVISPDEAARQIYHAVQERKQTVYVPGRWRWVSLIISNIPSALFRRLNL
ncbi:MAG: SDR family NAD(P)-dependent oxidoreductase [Candidatus Promineifilaceae bacterium]|nr:SDR family NAD(P)-dependent oxidoreductase [Candidatus Promineifilaceae bacterium]